MIMKLNVSNELKSRLVHAAENGSVIAKGILSEVKKNVPVEEIIRGTFFFTSKRMSLAITLPFSAACIRRDFNSLLTFSFIHHSVYCL